MTTDPQHDLLIVGAGISGIGIACHLRARLPHLRFAILEGRDELGGTWDLFRYPGVRSDSDLHTFGFEFQPWIRPNMLAGAEEILDYLRTTAEEHGVRERIRFGHRVLGASWDSATARWTVRYRAGGEEGELTCRWLVSATGYYDYEQGFRPAFPDEERFAGPIVHPQQWPEDLDHAGKRVVVIGSGATAVTLVPAMAERAAHVTMLQRSPGYIMPLPRRNPLANLLLRVLPDRVAHRITRRINIAAWRATYGFCRRFPRAARRALRTATALQLPRGYPVDRDFNPRYDPWDERLCAVPDGDLFRAIRHGDASVVTDRIERFTPDGIRLASGRELPADVVVAATGLRTLPFGGIAVEVDGRAVDLSSTVVFKGMMLSGLPSFAFALGYTNISWTLKVDLVGEHLCRLIAHVEASGADGVVPVLDDPTVERQPLFGDFQAGYIKRGEAAFPRRGSHGPWTVDMDYRADRERLRRGAVQDPALRLLSATGAAAAPAGASAAVPASAPASSSPAPAETVTA